MDLGVYSRVCTYIDYDYEMLRFKATFKGLLHQIPKLSRPYSVFKDFPDPGKMTNYFKEEFQGLSRSCGHRVQRFLATTVDTHYLVAPLHKSFINENRLHQWPWVLIFFFIINVLPWTPWTPWTPTEGKKIPICKAPRGCNFRGTTWPELNWPAVYSQKYWHLFEKLLANLHSVFRTQ